jgi:hypothetical protein
VDQRSALWFDNSYRPSRGWCEGVCRCVLHVPEPTSLALIGTGELRGAHMDSQEETALARSALLEGPLTTILEA